MKKSSFVYLDSKLRLWTKPDAEKELGEATRHRFGYDKSNRATGDIYAYPDPTQLFREFELNFDPVTKKLAGVYAYPWRMTWEECKQTWGSDATTIRNQDGTRFYAYRGRRLNVLADKNGNVISLGVY